MPVYSGNGIELIITGAGANASAQGVRYLRSINTSSTVQWINIGICGHGSLEVGTPLLIDRIIDLPSGRKWSLATHPVMSEPIGTLTCVPEPQSEYADDMAYDMESSGFIQAVIENDTLESARILKIVSDNPANDARGISGKFIHTLVEQQLGLIRSLIKESEI
ncbi:MAG: hypothetical protein PVI97_05335 [Candidatus Thiodiazotropha sp.]|jgi:hypothetical protein